MKKKDYLLPELQHETWVCECLCCDGQENLRNGMREMMQLRGMEVKLRGVKVRLNRRERYGYGSDKMLKRMRGY